MEVRPELARLRGGETAAQPRTDAALAAWRGSDAARAVADELASYGADEALGTLPELARVIGTHGAAAALAAGLIAPLLDALTAEPLAQLPLGHSAAPGRARLQLLAHGRAALALTAFAPRARTLPVSALFEDGAAHEVVIAGEGCALVHSLAGGVVTTRARALASGNRLARTGPDTARQIVAVRRPLLVLQLTREAARPVPAREIALADGRVLKTISGCKATSQRIMALAVLGALGHAPAVPAMARLACDRTAARDLRWEALRQALALDAGAGLAVLAALAGDPADPLHAPAAALQQQLHAQRPDLAALMPEPA